MSKVEIGGKLKPLDVQVERMGGYCVLKITGQLHGVIMPLKPGQAKRVIREMEKVLADIAQAKKGGKR